MDELRGGCRGVERERESDDGGEHAPDATHIRSTR
jgi:hypothetical protein